MKGAVDCGSRGRRFETVHPPQTSRDMMLSPSKELQYLKRKLPITKIEIQSDQVKEISGTIYKSLD